MHALSSSFFKWLTAVIGLLLAIVFVFNPNGWRDFIVDVASAVCIQLLISLVIFVILYVFALLVVSLTGSAKPTQKTLLVLFPVSAVASLAFIEIIFQRAVDFYDLTQTIILIIVFGLLVERVEQLFERIIRLFTFRQRSDVGKTQPSTAPAWTVSSPPQSVPRPIGVESALYNNLLVKARGDRELVERLIHHEKQLDPRKTRQQLIESAIVRWERDNR